MGGFHGISVGSFDASRSMGEIWDSGCRVSFAFEVLRI